MSYPPVDGSRMNVNQTLRSSVEEERDTTVLENARPSSSRQRKRENALTFSRPDRILRLQIVPFPRSLRPKH